MRVSSESGRRMSLIPAGLTPIGGYLASGRVCVLSVDEWLVVVEGATMRPSHGRLEDLEEVLRAICELADGVFG
jgi:hypothetical protein